MLFQSIRKSRAAKVVALTLAIELTCQWFFPNHAHALTTGPSQPEMQSFEPVGTSDMVDVFSGDFNYNIPLLDIDGYPINISYNGGVSMDQEASWVGLGWNINPGAINRNMRGLPDDFSGDLVRKEFNMKPNRTYGVSASFGAEAFGFDALSLSYGISANYNNYSGVGFEQSLNMQLSAGMPGKGSLTGGLGITSGSEGLNLSPSLSYSHKIDSKENYDIKGTGTIGLSFNSRSGLKARTLSASVTESATKVSVANGHIHHNTYTYSANGSASINFSTQTYTPQVSMPLVNSSFAVSFKTGASFFGLDGTLNLSGYYSEQRLERNEMQVPAFGYMNSQYGLSYDNAMLDLNREKEIAFTDKTPDLPVTNYTYDVYSVTGQGVGGNYRPFRSDLGTLCDPAGSTYSISGSLGVEAGVGNLVHGGSDVAITDVRTTSGKWSGDDNASGTLKFRAASNSSDPLYEPWYFKQAGEKAVDSDPALFSAVGASDPVQVTLQDPGQNYMNVSAGTTLKRQYANGSTASLSIPTNNYRSSRQRRNQAISYLPFSMADDALQPSILKHTHASMGAYNPSSTESQEMQKHHIGEITVLRSDGARYVYGLPAYNIMQREVTFNVQGRTHNCGTGIVTYSSGDNSTSNALGTDNYFSAVETPAYAHSYMLTAIISPDYVDYDGVEGPSKGDLGTYTKFNYTKAAASFNWRTPVGSNSANYNEGLKTDATDDKGSYIYGQKEIWYLTSIETKNYVAVFTLSNREDGRGVSNENGAAGGSALKKLDRIDLYSKPDYDANGTNATAIKSVYFEYDYSLCPGVPNRNPANGSGKLTLKKIYFTYSKSYKAKLSPYKFYYADTNFDGISDVNYSYNLKGYDRWGNYKPNVVASSCGNLDSLTTSEYPYVLQDTTTANQYAAAWSLTKIDLPSGSTIKVRYEADDYAYVQDRKAAQMFKITNVYEASGTGTPSTQSGTAGSSPARVPLMTLGSYSNRSYYIYFKLQEPVATGNIRNVLYNDYLGGQLTNIYFRFLADITKSSDYEYVSGYFDIDDNNSEGYGGAGAVSGNYQYGWLRLKKVPIGDRQGSDECNPISKATWQYGRLQLPRKVWDEPDPQASGVEQTLRAIAASNFFLNIYQTFLGPNKTIRNKGYGLHAVTQKSWIRLNNPNGKKLGGGSRVKWITISDNWKTMTSNSGYTPADASYGQVYSYTTTENGRTISSGVASYEPQGGGDENPFRQPVYFSDDKKLVPDDESYLEEPFGEMFFPAPGIGYSRVEVRNLQHSTVTRHATGYTVQEFYTAKDFPTITRRTDLEVKHKRTSPILSLLKIKMKDYLTASQGYVVELNDMHGKPKANYVYAENQVAPISEVHYFYKTNPGNSHQLDNTVYTVKKDGTVSQSLSGVDYDFVNDMREQQTQTISGGVNINLAGFIAGIFPCVVPALFPSWNQEQTRFRSTVVTKVINRYGILERTEAHDAGSTVTTENLAWDAETGELLLTKTKNDFDDPVYNFTYPAHWAYDGMGMAYKNLLVGWTGKNINNGVITNISSPSGYLQAGDELSITSSSGTHYKAWVCSISGSNVNLMDETGAALALTNSSCSVIVTRSGRRNQQALAVGGVTMLTCPLKDTNSNGTYDALQFNTSDKVLNAKAQEYSNRWQMFGGYVDGTGGALITCGVTPGDTINPYYEDVLGVWRAKRSYLYLASRSQSVASNNTDVRKDGYFVTLDHTTGSTIAFQPFWSPNSGNDWLRDSTYWTWSSEVTKYTPFGNEIENRDALDRYSAAVFGYRSTLPLAVASNARYQEIAYDGFEDYDFVDSTDCHRLHFNFYEYRSNRVSTEAHTGLYSMHVAPGDSVYNTRGLSSSSASTGAQSCPYTLSASEVAGTFSPITYNGNKTYVLSYWVKATGGTPPVFDYSADADVEIRVGSGSGTLLTKTLVQKSDIIEGWQQFQYTFTIPASSSGNIQVTLKNKNGSQDVYFDDIRLHPFDSNMKSYVYHPVNLRFTYELDENNYATIYEYDEEGALIRVKKETANGIMTIKESRNNTSH